jgi:hypothetical protein
MDFGTGSIEIRSTAATWGPYEFDFADALPVGETIVGLDIQAYRGKVSQKDSLSAFSTIATLIDVGSTTISGTKVQLRLTYPGTYPGASGLKCTIRFKLITDNNGKYPFFFYPVTVVGGA